MKRKGKRKMWIVIGSVIVCVAAILGGGIVFTGAGRRELKNLPIESVDFHQLKDGTYTGEYKGQKDAFRNARVQVTVASGKVSQIEGMDGALMKDGVPAHLNAKGDTIQDLYGRVVSSQSLQVDVISGATLTSKAHLKAVENAVKQAQAK